MAEPITMQQLADASVDAQSLQEVVNGDENTDVDSRLGESYPSIKKAINLMTQAGIGFTAFETKAKMLTDGASLADGKYAVVTNDVPANIGVYLKKTGSWALVPWNSFVNLDSLKINVGKDYPLKNMTRNNVQTYISPTTKNWLLGAVVENAVEDTVYTIDYYQNGNTQLSGGGNGWIIKRHPKATFATADNGVAIISYADSNTPLVRNGIQTLKLKSRRSSEVFELTIDTDALPAYGTAVNQTASNYPGYSAIIDESFYRYAKSINNKDMTCEVLVDKTTLIEFAGNEGYRIRITIGINGVNSLPNIKKVERKNAYGDAWSVVNESTSDWLPPMVVKALSNNDGSTYVKYTGGNHASSGGAEGDPTAVNKVFDILIDGMPINLEGINRQTKCSSVQIIIKNSIYAYNTTSLARAVVDQNFVLNIKPNVIAVSASITALENITVFRDNGLQAIVNGFITTQLYLDGKTKLRESYNTANDGGTKVTAPNVWALILQSASTRQQLTMSFDRSYGLGDKSQVDDASPLLFCSGSATQKAYGAIIKSTDGYTLNTNQSYKYRGAYSFDNTTTTANLDSIFTLPDGKCAVTNAYNYCK